MIENSFKTSLTACNYSYMQLGLMDFNARFYSPALGRFIQPDSIIPDLTNSQAWNRYSYTLNNPVKYIDPSGHVPLCLDGEQCGEEGSTDRIWNNVDRWFAENYHVEIDDEFLDNPRYKTAIYLAITAVGAKFAETVGGTSAQAFSSVFGATDDDPFKFTTCSNCTAGGRATGPRQIAIDYWYPSDPPTGRLDIFINQRFLTHEIGHAFDWRSGEIFGGDLWNNSASVSLGKLRDYYNSLGLPEYDLNRPDYGDEFDGYHGFAGERHTWQFAWNDSNLNGNIEIFADMFVGYTFDTWGTGGRFRANTMDDIMNQYLGLFVTP